MTFPETLRAHLDAIARRDLPALMATLPPPGEPITLVTSDGGVVTSVAEFEAMHRGWFESPTWSLATELVHAHESPAMGVAVLRLSYRDDPPGGAPIREESVLTLAFALRPDGRWAMVHDQNTPTRRGA